MQASAISLLKLPSAAENLKETRQITVNLFFASKLVYLFTRSLVYPIHIIYMSQGKHNHSPLTPFLVWTERHLTQRQFILLLSFFVGIGAALAAQILKWLIANIEHLLIGRFDITSANQLLLVYCLLYTSPSPRDVEESRMPSSA